MKMKSKLLNKIIFYHFLIFVVVLGCKKHNEQESKQNFEAQNIKIPLKISNTGSVEIKALKIYYDSNSCTINELKSGQTVYKDIDVNSPFMTLGFTIEYSNGKVIVHKPEEWGVRGTEGQELQIVIEDDGKIYFR